MAAIRTIAMVSISVAGLGLAFITGRWTGLLQKGESATSLTTLLPHSTAALIHLETPGSVFEQTKEEIQGIIEQKNDFERGMQMRDLAMSLDANTVKKLLEDSATPRDDKARGLQLELLTRWAHLDPKAAVAYAEKNTTSDWRMNLVNTACRAWAEVEPEAALSYYMSRKSGNDNIFYGGGNPVFRAAFATMAMDNPGKPFEWVKSQMKTSHDKQMISNMFGTIAEDDPKKASELLPLISKTTRTGYDMWGDPYGQALQILGEQWANKDRQGALAWAQSLTSAADRQQVQRSIVTSWSYTDPAAAVTYCTQNLPGGNAEQALDNIFSNWTMRSEREAAAYLQTMPEGDIRKKANTAYLNGLAYAKPKEVADLITTMDPKDYDQNIVYRISYQMAQEDKADAMAWIAKLPEGQLRNNAKNNIYSQWGSENPKEAAQFLLASETGDSLRSALTLMAGNWTRSDPKEALAFAQTLTDEKTKSEVISRVVSNWSDLDPKEAAAYMTTLSEAEREQAAGSVARNWYEADTAGATQWASSLPEGKARENAYKSLANEWVQYDTAKGAAWLQSLPQGTARDAAVTDFTRRVMNDEPQTAIQLASTLTDPKARTENLEQAARSWLRTDPTSAQAWIGSSDLPQESKNKLLKIK